MDGDSAAKKAVESNEPKETTIMKSNDQKLAAAQAQPTENRESFMTLLRDGLRATTE